MVIFHSYVNVYQRVNDDKFFTTPYLVEDSIHNRSIAPCPWDFTGWGVAGFGAPSTSESGLQRGRPIFPVMVLIKAPSCGEPSVFVDFFFPPKEKVCGFFGVELFRPFSFYTQPSTQPTFPRTETLAFQVMLPAPGKGGINGESMGIPSGKLT